MQNHLDSIQSAYQKLLKINKRIQLYDDIEDKWFAKPYIIIIIVLFIYTSYYLVKITEAPPLGSLLLIFIVFFPFIIASAFPYVLISEQIRHLKIKPVALDLFEAEERMAVNFLLLLLPNIKNHLEKVFENQDAILAWDSSSRLFLTCPSCKSSNFLWKSYERYQTGNQIKCNNCGVVLFIPDLDRCPICARRDHAITLQDDNDNERPCLLPVPPNFKKQHEEQMEALYAGVFFAGAVGGVIMRGTKWIEQIKENWDFKEAERQFQANKDKFKEVKLKYHLHCDKEKKPLEPNIELAIDIEGPCDWGMLLPKLEDLEFFKAVKDFAEEIIEEKKKEKLIS